MTMDDLEFRRRVLTNPAQVNEELTAAAVNNPERLKFIQEAQQLDARIHGIAATVSVPDGLAQRLKGLSSEEIQNTHSTAKPSWRRYMAIAATFVLAIGATLSAGLFGENPSAADIQLHNDVIQHVYREAPRFESNLKDMAWPEINKVVAAAGGHLNDDDAIKTMHVKFANGCRLGLERRAAHIVLEGTQGAVSVFMVKNSPVKKAMNVDDPRYSGKIIPFGEGNLIIVGEKSEPIETYESLITQSFQWEI